MEAERSRAARRVPANAQTALLFVAALAGAAVACLTVWIAYPKELDIETDIVGNPIFIGFNSRRYPVEYLLAIVVWPVLTIGLFLLFERFARRGRPGGAKREWLPRALPPQEPAPDELGRPGAWASVYLRLAAVGALLALVIAIGTHASESWLLTLLVPVTLGYALVARGLAIGVARWRSVGVDQATAAVNAVVAGFSLLTLAVASEAARVEVVDPPAEVGYDLASLPVLLALGIAVGVVVAIVVARTPPGGWARVERATLLSLVVATAVYCVIAQMAGQQGPPDLFHDGERLGAARLVADGAFPWRDLLFPHGVLSDVVLPALDRAAIDDSRWGLVAGRSVLEGPLLWISTFALCAWLFWRNWLFLLAVVAMLAFGWLDTIINGNDRMMLLPLSLLALAALLTRATWPRAFAFMAITVFQAITVPEATAYSAAAWAIVVTYEIVHRHVPEAAADPWARTRRIAIVGVGLGALFVAWLAANDALDDFVDYYKTFVRGHELTGALPIAWAGFGFAAKVFLPIVTIAVAWLYAGFRVWTHRWFTRADWVMGAAIIGLIPYYGKFLARADGGHLYQVTMVALVPALYVLYRLIQAVDLRALRTGSRWLAYRPGTVAFLAVVLIAAPVSLLTRAETLPARLTGVASIPPESDRLGYAVPGALPEALPRAIQRTVDRYTAGGGTMFDFTNSPLMFDYLVDARTATRFSHVSMAIRRSAQEELISELEAQRPALVAFSSRDHGLPVWDAISNPVRHYMVSDYLLDHYRPLKAIDDYVFMIRNDLAGAPDASGSEDLYFKGSACNWGLVPEFLDAGPVPGAEAIDLPLGSPEPATAIDASGWSGDLETGKPAKQVLVVHGKRILSSASLGAPRPDIAYGTGLSGLSGSGFVIERMMVAGDLTEFDELRFYAVGADGSASQLGMPGVSPDQPRALVGPGGRRVPVRQGSIDGSVDAIAADPLRRYRLPLPADAPAWNWLTVSSDSGFGDDRFVVSDSRPGPARSISWSSIVGRSTSLDVGVGSCPQWHGYQRDDVFLGVSADAPAIEARLTR